MSESRDEQGSEYRVGPGKPPKETQWKPGVSGNPKGRPKGSVSIVKDLRKKLAAATPGSQDNIAAELADILIEMARGRDRVGLSAIQTIMDRVDGPVVQRLAGPEGEPLFLQKVFVNLDPDRLKDGTLALPDDSAVEVEYEDQNPQRGDGDE